MDNLWVAADPVAQQEDGAVLMPLRMVQAQLTPEQAQMQECSELHTKAHLSAASPRQPSSLPASRLVWAVWVADTGM